MLHVREDLGLCCLVLFAYHRVRWLSELTLNGVTHKLRLSFSNVESTCECRSVLNPDAPLYV